MISELLLHILKQTAAFIAIAIGPKGPAAFRGLIDTILIGNAWLKAVFFQLRLVNIISVTHYEALRFTRARLLPAQAGKKINLCTKRMH